jgi:hypothetical protein
MRSSFGRLALLVGVGIFATLGARAEPPTSPDVAITYDALQANIVPDNNFWMQGGSVQLHAQFWRGLGMVADIAGLHTGKVNGTGAGLSMVTTTFGPRYTWPFAHHRYAVFAQALAGEANGFDSVFPTANGAHNSADGLALKIGGGMNLHLSRHLAVRVFEADWLRTQLPNATSGVQNNLRMGAGLVFKF